MWVGEYDTMGFGSPLSSAVDDCCLTDVVEVDHLQRLQDAFARTNGVSSIIRDLEGRPITRPSLLNEACRMVRDTSRGRDDCYAHLQKLSAALSSSMLPAYGRCRHLGLMHAGMPIVVKGRHLATWWISQKTRGTSNFGDLNKYAGLIGIEAAKLRRAYFRMPVGDQDALEVEIERLWNMVNDIISKAYRESGLRNAHVCHDSLELLENISSQCNDSSGTDGLPYLRVGSNSQPGIEEQLLRKTALLDAINQVFQFALAEISDVELAARCLKVACRLTSSRAGMIMDKESGGKWRILADMDEASPAANRYGSRLAASASPAEFHPALRQAIESGGQVLENKLRRLPWPDSRRSRRVSSLLGVCLGKGGRPFGLLVLADKAGGYRVADETDMVSLASAIAQALLRKRAETALARSERRLTLALTAANEGLWDLDLRAGKMYYSLKCYDLLGYPPGSLGEDPRAWQALVHPEDRRIVERYRVAGGGAEKQIKIDVRMRTAGGHWRWMRIRGKILKESGSGRPVRVIGTISDIHAYMETQAALEIANSKLQQLASRDDLTGIGNRRRFDRHLVRQWRRCRRDKVPLSLIICDIDHFKLYNDTYGHIQGDYTLKAVAQAIDATLKRPTDLVARFGGEEFAVILPSTGLGGAQALAGEIKAAVEQLAITHKKSGIAPHVTISLGVAATVPRAGLLPHHLVKAADMALYEAKAGGRNTIRIAVKVEPGLCT